MDSNLELESGKKPLAKILGLIHEYKAPILVFGILISITGIDYFFRNSNKNYYQLGLQDMTNSQFDAAIDDFSHALRQNPADPAARFGLGWAYHSKGWVDEALKQYEQAIKSGSDAANMAAFNSGVIYQQKQRLDEAVTSYVKTLAINPNSTGALMNLGLIYLETGKNDGALRQFARITVLEPTNASAFYNEGIASERLGKKEDAKKYYRSALEKDPNLPGAKERITALGG